MFFQSVDFLKIDCFLTYHCDDYRFLLGAVVIAPAVQKRVTIGKAIVKKFFEFVEVGPVHSAGGVIATDENVVSEGHEIFDTESILSFLLM